MPSPEKVTATNILSNKNSSPSSLELNKKQLQAMSSTTNNGFIRGNSSPLLNIESLNERRQSMDNQNSCNNVENSPLLHVRNVQNTDATTISSINKNFKSNSDLIPEIVVLSDKVTGNVEKAHSLNDDRELSNLRICENPLTQVRSKTDALNNEKSKTVFSRNSKSKVFDKRRNWLRKSTKLEKYLTCAIIVLILSLSIIFLAFLKKSDCIGLEKKVCLTEECVRTASSLLAAMDLTANPCQDFFQFACGTWNKKHVIPEDKSSVSTFEVLADKLQVILKGILEEPFDEIEIDESATKKAKLFYKSCMNIQKIRKIGDAPLRDILKKLGGWPVATPNWKPPSFSIETLLGKVRGDYNEGVLVEQWVGPDDKNSSINILQLDQMQLALPSRDYFLKSNSEVELKAYHNYMTQVAILLGANSSTAAEELEKVIKFEIQLANDGVLDTSTLFDYGSNHYKTKFCRPPSYEEDGRNERMFIKHVTKQMSHSFNTSLGCLENYVIEKDRREKELEFPNATQPEADRQDTSAIYQKLPLGRLQKEVPELDWKEYLSTFMDSNIQEDELVVTYSLPYFTEMGKILKKTDRRIIHNYVVWRLIMKITPHMIDEYQQKVTDFRKILLGILSERHRWSQCVEWTNKKIGMAVGALFIRENFNQDSKETALEMIHNIREAFNELLAENAWMDDETRAVAKEKADSMNERIGYPEFLTNTEELNKEYFNLTITEDQFLVNVLNVLKFEAYRNLQKLRQPVNKDKWSTEPAIVNAFYNPNKNDIVFPAGILQPLFYSQHFPKSLNYGGIGVVIGHEITHGFDDKGRQFDKDGNMMQWWNNATIKAFRERTQCIIDQYSRYKLDEIDLFVNGRMTQGENIADNGGLKQSFRAYKKWVAKHGEEPLLPGVNLTHDQLFFLNYAQIWCGSMRPEDALTKIRSSVHSPGPVRVLGPLSNSWDFANAYNCPPQSPMNPTSKCSVW